VTIALVAVVVLGALAWLGDAQQSIGVSKAYPDGYRWGLPSVRAAFDVAVAALNPFGGLPRDAQLRRVDRENMIVVWTSSGRRSIVSGYSFVWQPRDEVGWGDHIIVRVGASAEGSGSLVATYVARTWRPWPVRRLTETIARWRATLAPAPASYTSTCTHIDVLALRRAMGTVVAEDGPLSVHRTSWAKLVMVGLTDPQTVVAHWSAPYPTFDLNGYSLTYSDAVFVGQGGLYIHLVPAHALRSTRVPEWDNFLTAVNDPVCPPRRLPTPSVDAT
jgi:hypothetical protein